MLFRSYIKQASEHLLAPLVAAQLRRLGVVPEPAAALPAICALFKDRCTTTVELAEWSRMYFDEVAASAEDLAAHVTDGVRPALQTLRARLDEAEWTKAGIAAAIKETLAAHALKMPQLAPAVRLLVSGRVQTPSLDSVLLLFRRDIVVQRLQSS